jgi:hypothetical protein
MTHVVDLKRRRSCLSTPVTALSNVRSRSYLFARLRYDRGVETQPAKVGRSTLGTCMPPVNGASQRWGKEFGCGFQLHVEDNAHKLFGAFSPLRAALWTRTGGNRDKRGRQETEGAVRGASSIFRSSNSHLKSERILFFFFPSQRTKIQQNQVQSACLPMVRTSILR